MVTYHSIMLALETSIDSLRAMCMPCPSEWLSAVPIKETASLARPIALNTGFFVSAA